MTVWAVPALLAVLLASALLLRRWPLPALAVTLGGAVATRALEPTQATALQIVLACAVGLEICYLAAARARKVSVTGLAMVGAGLLIFSLLRIPSLDSRSPGGDGNVGPDVPLSRSPFPWSRSSPGLSEIQSGRLKSKPN
jgi:hypothetical protein